MVMFRAPSLRLRACLRCVFLRRFTATPACDFPSPESTHTLEQVRVLCTCGRLQEAISLFHTLDGTQLSPLSQTHQTYAALFRACAIRGLLRQGRALHLRLHAEDPSSPADMFLTNHLVNMYAKCGHLDYAHQLLDEMPRRNVVSWTALVSGYAQHGRAEDCFRAFSGMLAHCRPSEFAFTSVLVSCNLDRGRQVHALAMKVSFDVYLFVGNALISMYFKNCDSGGICSSDRELEAWTAFKTMKFRNLITWNSMIAGFQKCGLGFRAIEVFSQMHREGIEFDGVTLLTVLSSLCEANGNIAIKLGLQVCFQLHCLAVKTGSSSDLGVATALIKACSSLGGEVMDCYGLFLETQGHRDIVLWTAIISVFAEHYPTEAFALFCQLCGEDLALDPHTFSVVLKACASFATQRHAGAIHSQIVKIGLEYDTVVRNALIHAYARCGGIALSEKVFNEMMFHNVVSWNTMLKAYALHGRAEKALQLFSQMTIEPDARTFVSLLAACSHAGMVEEGFRIFNSMHEKYGIAPLLDHYACMVDILGRAGRVVEAEELVRRMPIEPDSVVWSALLGASRKHSKTWLAKLAAAKLNELDPGNSLGYVQISNVYCSSGSFNEAGLIRKEMHRGRIRKQPGLSWIEIGNKIHEFTSGAPNHPERERIFTRLEGLVGQLKEKGYSPDTSLALHDVEEEQKEEQLYRHSEKLALIFALMNEGSLNNGDGIIKIMKNIRICLDCHNFMKLASDIVQKEIVIRDSNRFHHFKDGVCSCDDYW